MRLDWVPVSASALVTGAMALVLGQMLNPVREGQALVSVLATAETYSQRWLAMSVLFFVSAVGLVLGLPCVLSLFARRGRRLAMVAVGVLAVGTLGLACISAVMIMARALVRQDVVGPRLVVSVFEDRGLSVALQFWLAAFVAGVVLVAVALLHARKTPVWVPGLLLSFVLLEVLSEYVDNRLVDLLGLMAFAAGLTGIATTATSAPLDPTREWV